MRYINKYVPHESKLEVAEIKLELLCSSSGQSFRGYAPRQTSRRHICDVDGSSITAHSKYFCTQSNIILYFDEKYNINCT